MSKLKMGELNQSKIQNTDHKKCIKYVHPHIQKNLVEGHTWKDMCGPQQILSFSC
jgi:hypothetical protein